MPPWWAMNDYNRCVTEYVLVKGRADVTVGDIIVERAEAGTILGELALYRAGSS